MFSRRRKESTIHQQFYDLHQSKQDFRINIRNDHDNSTGMVQIVRMKLLLATAFAASCHAASSTTPGLRGAPLYSNATLGVSYDEGIAQHQLNLCQAAYCVTSMDWSCPTCDSGIVLEAVVQNKGGSALVGMDTTNNNLFVAYRGSSNIQNWIQNVKFVKTSPYPDMPDVSVELGFWEWYNYLLPGVTSALQETAKKYGVYTVAVTGHSAGASCATLHAFDLARGADATAGFTLAQVVTFGSPRTGDENFYSTHAELIPASQYVQWRVTHYHDMVPHMPQELVGYHHVSTEVYYDEPSTTHQTCDGSGEDPDCSNSCGPTHCTSVSDHLDYLNTPLGGDAC